MKPIIKLLPCMLLLLLMACSGKEAVKKYSLTKTDKKLTFALDAETKNEMYSYAVYRDKTGKNYFTFKNRASNTLLFYDIDTESFEYKVDFPVEGNHGVGLAEGYYIHNLDSIYLPNRDVKEISLSDKNGFLHAKYSYDKDATNEELSRYGFSSAYLQPAEVIGRTMYLYPRTTIEKEVRPFELLAYGRKNFSTIILDKEFNKIGETLFPDYTYSAKGMIILEDGLYISDSHYLNPQFSDDVLSFVRFELTAEK